jgi:hypothetical protein
MVVKRQAERERCPIASDFIALSRRVRGRMVHAAERAFMEVVCVIGERLYHASGSDCHRMLEARAGGPVLMLTEAQAHEVGMEPCGVCVPPGGEGR